MDLNKRIKKIERIRAPKTGDCECPRTVKIVLYDDEPEFSEDAGRCDACGGKLKNIIIREAATQ